LLLHLGFGAPGYRLYTLALLKQSTRLYP
jgi:hypothetical protein